MITEDLTLRRYRGASTKERRAQRQDLLVRAAIRIYGETGYRNATVKAVCDAAGLTERYFYESFANSEALLIAAYARVNRTLIDGIEQVIHQHPGDAIEKGRAALRFYFTALQQDKKLARMFLVELTVVSPAVELAYGEAQDDFAALLLRALDPGEKLPAAQRDLLARGVVGAIAGIALYWISNGHERPIEELVAASLEICLLLAR